MTPRHNIILARIIGIVVTLAIFSVGFWCSINLRENGVSWFGLSPDWTGRLGAGVFLILFLIVMRKFGEIFMYGWIKVANVNIDDPSPSIDE